jgi:hypothetical protein
VGSVGGGGAENIGIDDVGGSDGGAVYRIVGGEFTKSRTILADSWSPAPSNACNVAARAACDSGVGFAKELLRVLLQSSACTELPVKMVNAFDRYVGFPKRCSIHNLETRENSAGETELANMSAKSH